MSTISEPLIFMPATVKIIFEICRLRAWPFNPRRWECYQWTWEWVTVTSLICPHIPEIMNEKMSHKVLPVTLMTFWPWNLMVQVCAQCIKL